MPRWARVDPWGPLAALVGTGVFLLQGFDGPLTRDVAVYAYAGQQVAEGVPPYVQILNRAGPLAHLVPGAGVAVARLVGGDDLIGMRVTMMVLSALALWAAYVLGRDLFGSRLTGVMTSAVLLSFEGFVTYATGGPREKTTLVLLMLLALWGVARRRWLTAGVATALATLAWQGALVPLVAVVVVAVTVLPGGPRPRLVALARFAGAGLAVAAVTVVYFVAVGALAEFWQGFYAVNALYSTQRGLGTMLAAPRQLVSGFGWSLALVGVGVVGSFVVAGARLRRFDRESPGEVATVALSAGTLGCLAWALLSFEGWPDAFPFLPFAACGVAGLAHLLLLWRPSVAAERVGVVAVVLLVVATATTALRDRPTGLEEQQRHNDLVLGVLDDPTLLSVSDPAPLVLAGLRNPIRYQIFAGGQALFLRDHYPDGVHGVAREIDRIHPTLITVRGRPFDWLRPVLDSDYHHLGGRRQAYSWYASDSGTTEEERAELRDVVRDTLPPASGSDVQRSLP